MSHNSDNSSSKDGLSGAGGMIPESLKSTAAELKARFLAAGKNTRYALTGGGVIALIVLLSLVGVSTDEQTGRVTFTTRRGDLPITVLEGGSLEALQSQELRSEIKGRDGVKILKIIEEGYRVTQADVDNGLVLVELDTAALIDQQLNQRIAVETAEATYIERKAEYEIQLNQNATDLNDARQDMRFALLDFEKFLGGNVVREIIAKLQIEERLAKAEAADLAAMAPIETSAPAQPRSRPDFAGGFDSSDIDSLPEPMQERIRQMMADNGGVLPAEMLERMQQFSRGGGPPAGGQRGQGGTGGFAGGPAGVRDGQPADEDAFSDPVEDGVSRNSEPAELLLPAVASNAPRITPNLLMDDSYMAVRNTLDFTQYASIDVLEDGEAKQQLRTLQDELKVAQEEYLLAQDRIEGQRRLEARGFITPTELEAEELNLDKAENKKQQKETALKLYIQYTFPKDAEQKLSDYENFVMGFQRQIKENIAEQAQEEARFSSAEQKFNLEKYKLQDLDNQIVLATIKAQQPGLVVYGAADQNSQRYRGGGSQEAIQEGATVRERQPILTIPDMREMGVKVNIHESAVQRVAVGQKVNISIDAFPDERMTGVVTKVAVVADSANAFMNPDLKVYPTTIKIDGTYDWLRPGMSAEVEIQVETLTDVIYVPLQAVTYFGDKRVVYVASVVGTERREIKVGTFSEQFIEITEGLREGEEVLLLAPQQELADAEA